MALLNKPAGQPDKSGSLDIVHLVKRLDFSKEY